MILQEFRDRVIADYAEMLRVCGITELTYKTAELVEAAQNGDRKAFNILMKPDYKEAVKALCDSTKGVLEAKAAKEACDCEIARLEAEIAALEKQKSDTDREYQEADRKAGYKPMNPELRAELDAAVAGKMWVRKARRHRQHG